jgi:hypothetical protein
MYAVDEIKHEVMSNHLFQQQCSKMWIGDVSGDIEGIVIRRTKGNYIACPPPLIHSPLAYYASLMNVHVSLVIKVANWSGTDSFPDYDDCELTYYPYIPAMGTWRDRRTPNERSPRPDSSQC